MYDDDMKNRILNSILKQQDVISAALVLSIISLVIAIIALLVVVVSV